MMHSSFGIRTVCFGVIAALAFVTAVPAWAQEPEYVDPTIVKDDKDEQPEGVKNLGAEQVVAKKKWEYNTPPIYTKWWFWVASVAVTAAVVTLAVIPLTRHARPCETNSSNSESNILLNCFGDGR